MPSPWQRAARAWPWLKLILGVALIGLLGWLVDWPGALRILRQTEATLALVAMVVLALALVVSTLKWQRLASAVCGPLPFPPLLRAYWIGTFLSNYLPSNVGGDVVRVLVLRARAPLAPLAGSVLAERLTGVTALALISAVCLAIDPIDPWKLYAALWLLVAAILAGVTLVFAVGVHLVSGSAALVDRLPNCIRRFSAKVALFGEAVAVYRTTPGVLGIALLWSLLFYALIVLFQFTLLRAVGSVITLRDAALVAPLIPLVSLLPVSANGLGLTEGAFLLFYTQMGVPADQAFAAALLRRLVTVFMSLPGGLLWLSSGPTADVGGGIRT